MKRKRADRADWLRLRKRRFATTHLETPEFTGEVALLSLDELEPPLYSQWTPNLCVAATGYSWLQQFPDGQHYALTTMFDAQGNIVQEYIDILGNHGVEPDGVPWYEDLYLDIIHEPGGRYFLVDQDELEEALTAGKVTQEQYDLAWAEARDILEATRSGQPFWLTSLASAHQQLLLSQLSADTMPGVPRNRE